MKCILLAAGYGTRLYPLTKNTAKPLLPIRGKPIIEHIANKIQNVEQVNEIVIISNHRFAGDFTAWAGNYASLIPIKVIDDGSTNPHDRLGAVRDLALVMKKEDIREDLLVVGADNMFSFTLDAFIENALSLRSSPLIGVFNLNDKAQARKFGVVALNEQKQVVYFYEKPAHLETEPLVSLCLYYLPQEKLHRIDEYLSKAEHDHDAIGNYFKWLSQNETVYAHEFDGTWMDIGDVDAYSEAVLMF